MSALNIFKYYALGNHLKKFYYGLYANSTKIKFLFEILSKKTKIAQKFDRCTQISEPHARFFIKP